MEEEIRLRNLYPFHFYVFQNKFEALKEELEMKEDLEDTIDMQDIHGRTPLMLAIVLRHIECAELLLEYGADANTQNKEMWILSQEAILLKNSDFLKKVLTLRDYQRALQTSQILRELKQSFKDTPDFYVEMAWEFTSWLPFVKNMCPCDTYKIYKHGNNIRIDANMFEISANERPTGDNINGKTNPNQSFIFRFASNEVAEIIFLDRNERIAYVQNLDLQIKPIIEDFVPSETVVMEKIKSPITTTYINLDGVGFARTQKSSGLLSWIGSIEKEEEIEGYTCRLFNASNVEIVTKTCFDHLTESERQLAIKDENVNKTLSILLGLFEKKRVDISPNRNLGTDIYNELNVVDYLTKSSEDGKPNIGEPREEHIKTNSFNASLWLSESFPLNLREQIFPVIDLLAVRNAKFSRLKRFIQLQMPSGFPIRIKIPIFHLINAQVTFRNVNEPNENVVDHLNNGENEVPFFMLKQSLFQIPEDFEKHGMTGSLIFNRIEEIERNQSGNEMHFNTIDVEDGGEYVYLLERFMAEQNPQTSTYEQQLQLAIEQSLKLEISSTQSEPTSTGLTIKSADDNELIKVLELSKFEEEQRKQKLKEEEDQLKAVLERSLLDQ